jgi:prepilin-type N-terminal cleavage/methylation domain-containing protein
VIKRVKKCKKGLTLLEVIISLAILSITIIPLSTLVLTSIKTSNNSEYKQRATAVAQKLLEELKLKGSSAAETLKLLDDTILLNKMVPPYTGYNLGYKTLSNVDLEGFKVNISFQRKDSFKTNVPGNIEDKFDIIIEMTGEKAFKLTSNAYNNYPFTVSSMLYISEISDTAFEIYDFSSVNNKTLLYTLSAKSGAPGKVKITYQSSLSSSTNIKLSSYNTTDSSNLLTAYCYKNNASNFTNTISNIGGFVRVYDNLSDISPSQGDATGVYDAKIEVLKEIDGISKKIYEVKSTININN